MDNYNPLPSQERLQYLFYYSPEFGKLYARFKRPSRPIGFNGNRRSDDYLKISVDGTEYRVNRLVWMYVTGKDPGNLQIDHKDNNPLNNRIDNLRAVTRSVNQENRQSSKGYCFDKRRNKYRSYITINGKQKFLGYFTNTTDARKAYLDAKRLYHPTVPEEFYK